jgi:cysteinyl-tRNA synthetase
MVERTIPVKTVMLFFLVAAALSCRTLFIAVPAERLFSSVNDYLLQRRNIDLNEIGRSRYDMVVIDYSRDGTDGGAWSVSEITALKTAGEGRFVLAYLSIGEAESFRSYWETFWNTGSPYWVGREVAARPDNYRVKYWDPAWKDIIKGELAKIASQGFEGVYLDRVDAYGYWSAEAFAGGENEVLSPEDAADRMAEFVRDLAEFCRTFLGKEAFIICPAGGGSLRVHASIPVRDAYLRAVDAAAEEDVFFPGDGTSDNPYAPRQNLLSDLSFFTGMGKPVFVTEYLSRTNTDDITRFYTEARGRGFIPFAADRDLGGLRINSGYEPD